MDRNGHITDVPYRAGDGVPPGVEVLDFPGLISRATGHDVEMYSPKRHEFHELIAVRGGTLRTSVDFSERELTAGDWLWVRPGQVHQYRSDLREAEGRIILFVASFLGTATAEAASVDRGTWHSPPELAAAERDALWQTLDLLDGEYRQWGDLPREIHVEVLRHLVSCLVLRLAHLRGGPRDADRGGEAFLRFQQEVEADFTRTHRVEDYADRLGYSVRTLTRATQAAVGRGAKRFIDDRVLLEAKRLLVHTDLSAAAVGSRLGFPDPTVFAKFFRQRTDRTPAAFRAHAAGGEGGGRWTQVAQGSAP